jgi:hypothetical protein
VHRRHLALAGRIQSLIAAQRLDYRLERLTHTRQTGQRSPAVLKQEANLHPRGRRAGIPATGPRSASRWPRLEGRNPK